MGDATTKPRRKTGRPPLTAASRLFDLDYIRANACYHEVRDAAGGYDDPIEEGARAGRFSISKFKPMLGNFEPTLTGLRRRLKKAGMSDEKIEAELASIKQLGGPYNLTWRKLPGGTGYALEYKPRSSPPRKPRVRSHF